MKNTERDYSEMKEALKPLGLSMGEPGFFVHTVKCVTFDFRECSLEGVVCKIFNQGWDHGYQGFKEELQSLIL